MTLHVASTFGVTSRDEELRHVYKELLVYSVNVKVCHIYVCTCTCTLGKSVAFGVFLCCCTPLWFTLLLFLLSRVILAMVRVQGDLISIVTSYNQNQGDSVIERVIFLFSRLWEHDFSYLDIHRLYISIHKVYACAE